MVGTVNPRSEANLSKKCPMCNTVNDASAESCKYCGYLFEDSSLNRIQVTPNVAPQNVVPPSGVAVQPVASSPVPRPQTSTPVFVISKSWKDKRNLGSFIVPIFLVILILFSGGFDVFSLLFLIVPVVFILPIFLSNKTFEFYENSLIVSGGRGMQQQIQYSDISEVKPNQRSGNSFYLVLKNQWRGILIQGTLKAKTIDADPFTWLSRKIQDQSNADADTNSDKEPKDSRL